MAPAWRRRTWVALLPSCHVNETSLIISCCTVPDWALLGCCHSCILPSPDWAKASTNVVSCSHITCQ